MKGPEKARPVVWVVDDSPLDASRTRQVLEGPYEVMVFADGSAMLEHLSGHAPPDVLVLDWLMPGVTGIEVCRFLRGESVARPQLAILLLTMQTRTDDIVEGLAAGANDYLVKPYADPELRARVDALVRSNGLLERAQKAEASVLSLLENAPDPLLSVDRNGRVSYVNAEAQRVFDKSAPELVGEVLEDVLPVLSVQQLREAAQVGLPLTDIQIGDQIFSPTIRSLPSNEDTSLTIALRDVTSRRNREARRLDFYSIIAHDLRSPLGAMLMRTELMLRGHRGVLSTEMIADLRKMDGNMRRLVALINDFLDFARMEDGAHKMQRTPVDLAGLMAEVVDEFKPLVEGSHQRLQLDAGAVVALGDRSRLQQVLTNLLANAIKFSPAGCVISLGARQTGPWCEVTVEDQGPGIAPEIVPALFQRYSRAPMGASGGDSGGTGLGLLIVREIVEAHGGTVGVDSVPGKGSKFWFRVPAAASLVVDGAAPVAASLPLTVSSPT